MPDRSDSLEIRLNSDQLRALDAWRVKHRETAATREDAVRHLVQAALSHELQLSLAAGHRPVDEGLRPDQLSSENDD
ncbi:MAG: hypothetical protein ABWY78_18530 [Microvirga sp.]